MDLNLLLARVMTDPIALVQRVIQQAVDQLDLDGIFATDDGDSAPDELLAAALGNGLARMMTPKNASVMAEQPAARIDGAILDHYEELLTRNGVLAAALGACDCWGQHLDCPVCGGIGGPGWITPDEQFFASYVRPALRTATKVDGPPAGTGQHRREEHGDVQHVTH